MKYTAAKCKLCRREGVKLFLKGERCFSEKCPIERKGAVPPGEQGQKRRRRSSEYGTQLRAKQKAKRLYSVNERQFRNYYLQASKSKANTSVRFLQILESRLDNIVFRGGLTPSRSVARQLVTHGHVLVNGEKSNIPSRLLKPDDTINLSIKALAMPDVKKSLENKDAIIPDWLKRKASVVKVNRLPKEEEIDADINVNLIIEFYSR
jgi:small subunit ribosomal protein S4